MKLLSIAVAVFIVAIAQVKYIYYYQEYQS